MLEITQQQSACSPRDDDRRDSGQPGAVLHRERRRRRVLNEEAERAVKIVAESRQASSISRLAAAFPPIIRTIVGPSAALPLCRSGSPRTSISW